MDKMKEGLFLSVQEFNKLPSSAKLTCLYENQVKSFEILDLQKKAYIKIQINQRIQYAMITGIVGALIFLIKNIIGGN